MCHDMAYCCCIFASRNKIIYIAMKLYIDYEACGEKENR